MSDLSVSKRMTMSLDEIELYNKNIEISSLKSKINELRIENNNLERDLRITKNLYNENIEIPVLFDWIIHLDSNGSEYVRGYKCNQYNSIWETSFIKSKICMSTYILIITETESLYCLPYCESNK